MSSIDNTSNPYNESIPSQHKIFIGYDFDKSPSLYELIDKFKTAVKDTPLDSIITLYIVASDERMHSNISDFTSYLLSSRYNIQIIFRGNIHADIIGLLLTFGNENVFVPKNTQWVYSQSTLNELLLHLERWPEIFNLFIDRWKSHYKHIDRSYLNLDELTLIGINFQTY